MTDPKPPQHPTDAAGLSLRGELQQADTPPAEGRTLDAGPQETRDPGTGRAWPVCSIAAGCPLVAGILVARLALMYLWPGPMPKQFPPGDRA